MTAERYTRADDERILRILALHRRGHSNSAIARALGMTNNAVAETIMRVRAADCAHDPEAAPWWGGKRKETR